MQSVYRKKTTSQRSFLFLQGPPSGFAKRVGNRLEALGDKVIKINFCPGDDLYWRGKNVLRYRGKTGDWAEYIRETIRSEGITDVVYYADRLPYHHIAAKVAREEGANDISIEFGYLRPDWILIERGGQSSYSHFPDDLGTILEIAETIPEPDFEKRFSYPFWLEAANEVVFNLTNYFGWFLYPHYNTDKVYNPVFEYLAYIPRLAAAPVLERRATKVIDEIAAGDNEYFVVPLQMQNDYQIRCNSAERDQIEIAEKTIASFSKHARNNEQLIYKVHPLDNGLINWRNRISRVAKQHGVDDRVRVIDGGDLHRLIRASKGVIVVNSTTGLQSLELGKPTKVMGIAVYDIAGLSDSQPIDGFWSAPQPPSLDGIKALRKVMANSIHVKGDFYSLKGQSAGASAIANKLSAGRVNDFGCYADPPPRVAKAVALGVAVDW